MKAIPKGNFLLRQDIVDGKLKDVIARKGISIEVSEDEYKKFSNRLIKDESKPEQVIPEPVKVEPKKEVKKVPQKKKTKSKK